LTAKQEGIDGNNVTLTAVTSTNATVTATTSGAELAGGARRGRDPPGEPSVTIEGNNSSFQTASAECNRDAPQQPGQHRGIF